MAENDDEKKILDLHPTPKPQFVAKDDKDIAKQAAKIIHRICDRYGVRIVSLDFTKNVGIGVCKMNYKAIGNTTFKLSIDYSEKDLTNGVFRINLLGKLSRQIKENHFGVNDFMLLKMLTDDIGKNTTQLAQLVDKRRYFEKAKNHMVFELARANYIALHGNVKREAINEDPLAILLAQNYCQFVEDTWVQDENDIVPSPEHAILDSVTVKWFLKYMTMTDHRKTLVQIDWHRFGIVATQEIIASAMGVKLTK